MSLISKQIDELRAYAKGRKGELAKLISDAADTVEKLSAKLHSANMERSIQYYNDGWIPCKERLPEEELGSLGRQFSDDVIVSIFNSDDEDAWVDISYTVDGDWTSEFQRHCEILAWMPLPEPYKPKEKNNACD